MISISKLYCGMAEPGDALRYASAGGRAAALQPVIVWNATQRCNLRCVHCYSQSEDKDYGGELSTAEARAMLADLAGFGVPVILFSGGGPMMRPDIYALLETAARLGMRAVLSTNGTLLDAAAARQLRATGAAYVGISLDGLREVHDAFRGAGGAFDRALEGIRCAREGGLRVGLRFTITRRNAGEMDGIFDLAAREKIPRLCFYHLVYAGRAGALAAEDLGPADARRTMDRIIDRTADLCRTGRPVEVLTVDNHADGPYLVLRMRREGNPRAAEALRLLRMGRGNSSGVGIGCIGWDGTVYADQFWRHAALGNIRERPFSKIWTDLSHPLLAKLRARRPHLKGRCAACRWVDVCGGNFRVRAEAATGDLWQSDPACYLTDDEIADEDARVP